MINGNRDPPGDQPAADVQHLSSSDTAVPVMAPDNDNVNQQVVIMSSTGIDRPSTSGQTAIEGEEDANEFEEAAPNNTNNNDVRKQRIAQDGTDIGVEQVDEQAPQLNRRFYLGLDRASVRERNARARQERARRRRRQTTETADDAESQMRQSETADASNTEGQRRNGRRESRADNPRRRSSLSSRMMSALVARVSNASVPEVLIEATLVEDNEGGVVVAERVTFLERHWKKFAFILCFFFILMGVLMFVANDNNIMPTTDVPSMKPSSPPTFDKRPTLEIVQERGVVRCGLWHKEMQPEEGVSYDLCRSVAAVVLGDPKKIELVPTSVANRFQMLHDRSIDLQCDSATHTIEREVREPSTGSGFTFSSPYYYDGLAYLGNATFVACAEEQIRYKECANLRICVQSSSTHYAAVESSFPSDFFTDGPTHSSLEQGLLNGICNVIANDRSLLVKFLAGGENDNTYTVGSTLMTNAPIAIATRNNDREFSDVVNWVIQALFYGEEQGLAKNPSLCQNDTNLTGNVSDLVFLNAVYCVGSYSQIYKGDFNYHHRMNSINNDNTGMIYATPFGELENVDDGFGGVEFNTSRLEDIRAQKTLNCGVLVPEGFDENITESSKLVGMSVDYCGTLAAALFNGEGDFERVNITTFSENVSTAFSELDNGRIDVLAGSMVEQKYDFESFSSQGFQFSTPYYYGNETAGEDVTFISLATREGEDNVLFSSFVNAVVVATIYAQENGIKMKQSKEMPLMSIFGSELKWALRDAISHLGNYDEIYTKNFGYVAEEDRGRNILNEKGGPQLHSFPGLTHGQ